MSVSVVACGARNKDYSEISKILKDNDYEFEVQIDCSYAFVQKSNQDYVYGMLEGSNDLFYIDNTDESGQGVLDVENDKLYETVDLKKELTSEEDKKQLRSIRRVTKKIRRNLI